jgi:hypothetical protein
VFDAGGKGRLAAIVRELDIPVPFDLAEFAARLERRRNRPIVLCPFTSGPGMPCGLWLITADADYVYYEASTSPLHAAHIGLHELAHMLLGHGGAASWQRSVRLLAPDVDQTLIKRILGRSTYRTAEEREAETLASFILSGLATG